MEDRSLRTPPSAPPLPPQLRALQFDAKSKPGFTKIDAVQAEKRHQKEKQFRLTCALEYGDIDKVDELIQDGVNVNAIIVYVETPLTRAIGLGHEDIAIKLIKNGADVNCFQRNAWKRPALHLAVDKNFILVVESLLNHGGDVNSVDGGDMTPMHYAAYLGHLDILLLLLEHGADFNATDDVGQTPLRRAVEGRHFDVIDTLLHVGASVNSRDRFGWTPICHAVAFNDLELLQYLLLNGADVNVQDYQGNSPLHIASARLARTNIFAILSTSFAFYYRRKRIPTIELQRSVLRQTDTDINIIESLVSFGADVNMANKDNRNAIFYSEKIISFRYLVYSGSRIHVDLLTDASSCISRTKERRRWANDLFSKQITLQWISRGAVRQHLTRKHNIHSAIAEISYPQKLKNFIMLCDLEDDPLPE